MRLLLGSGGISTEERIQAWTSALAEFVGTTDRALLIAWAQHDQDRALAWMRERAEDMGVAVDGIHEAEDPRAAIEDAQLLYVTGGNSFRLAKRIHEAGVIDTVRRRVAEGMPYVGVSAGSNVACPTIATTNDMPICQPASFEAFGLIPFQINPHFTPGRSYHVVDGEIEPYAGETRLRRLQEYHEMNDVPVLAMREGGILRVDGDSARLVGPAPALLLEKGEAPRDITPGADLSRLLER